MLFRHNYDYDGLGRRTAAFAEGKHFEIYPHAGLLRTFDYNNRSEVTGATEYFATSITDTTYAIRGRVWDFGYDNAGNRTSMNGDTFTNNVANQLTQRVVPGQVVASGMTSTGAGYNVDRITLKATTDTNQDSLVTYEEIQTESTQYQPARRYQNFFYADLNVDNSAASLYAELSIYATDNGNNAVALEAPAGYQFVPQTPEAFTYDNEGNLTGDGRWTYSYDSENRLVAMETKATAYNAGAPRRKLEFAYDYLGRRFSKKVYSWNSTSDSFLLTSHLKFLYDGWNLIAELDALNSNTMIKRYYWGLDLSGGGAGGLYAMVDNSSGSEVKYFAQYDGNGNLVGWSGTSGDVTATYEYSPFGESLAERYNSSGDQGRLGKSGFRFSTQYYDAETGLYYYGYRYYNPKMGRFINRDPIGFSGGLNLYGFVGNNTPNAVDIRGLKGPSLHHTGLTGTTEQQVQRQTEAVSSITSTDTGFTDFFGSGLGTQFTLFGGSQFTGANDFNNIAAGTSTSAGFVESAPDYVADTARRGFIGHTMFRARRGLGSFERDRIIAGDKYPFLTLAMYGAPGFSGGYFGARDFEEGNPISGTLNFAFAAAEIAPLGKFASGLRFAAPRVPSLSLQASRNLFDEPIRFFDLQLTPQMGLGVMPPGTRATTTNAIIEQTEFNFVTNITKVESPTFLYQKVGPFGEHLKFGITKNPATRYTNEELGGGRLRFIAEGPRKEMLKLERDLHETLPIGPEEAQHFYIQRQIEKGLSPPPYE